MERDRVPLCAAPGNREGRNISGAPRGGVVPCGPGGWIAAFTDASGDSGDVYAQRVSASGVAGFDHTIMTVTGPPLAGRSCGRRAVRRRRVRGSSQTFA